MSIRRGLLRVIRVPGLLPYQEGVARQEALAAACAGGGADTLLVCEVRAPELCGARATVCDAQSPLPTQQHPPVFTVGKRCTTHNVRATPEVRLSCRAAWLTRPGPETPVTQELAATGASVEHTLRGGDVTFHGPGQLVLYPVVHLRRAGLGARAFVEGLEDVLVALAARHAVSASGRMPGAPGVWVGADTVQARKLGAVGVRISGGISTHGCALNVATDLRWFSHIVPCGIPDKVRAGCGGGTRQLRGMRPPRIIIRMVADASPHHGARPDYNIHRALIMPRLRRRRATPICAGHVRGGGERD
jgi:lipoate-protein ligase B